MPPDEGGRCDPAGVPYDEYGGAAGFYGNTGNDDDASTAQETSTRASSESSSDGLAVAGLVIMVGLAALGAWLYFR